MEYVIYVIFSLLWAMFATRMQDKLRHSLPRRLWLVFIINLVLAPAAMVLAIIKCPTE